MLPVFDPRAFDARAFYAPHDKTTVEPQPGRVTVSVAVTVSVTVTTAGAAVTCSATAPTVVVSCGPAGPT